MLKLELKEVIYHQRKRETVKTNLELKLCNLYFDHCVNIIVRKTNSSVKNLNGFTSHATANLSFSTSMEEIIHQATSFV